MDDTSGQPDDDRDAAAQAVDKLNERRRRYTRRSLPFRIAWTTAGFIVLAGGIAMVVFPGPAIIFIPAGLAMLSFEFTWAERLLDFALTRGMDAKQYAEHMIRRKRDALIIAGVCLLIAVAGGIAWYVSR